MRKDKEGRMRKDKDGGMSKDKDEDEDGKLRKEG